MKKNFIISIMLCVSILFYGLFFANVQQARAIPLSIANLVPDLGVVVSQVGDTIADVGSYADQIIEYVRQAKELINSIIGANAIVVAKVAALLAVQEVVALLIGDSDGQPQIIRDYKNYLYVSPQQRAMEQMALFFNATSKGRLSYLNYEGIGPNYDLYLVAQARQAIAGRPFVTNIQELVTNPSTDMFSSGNMKGVMAYMQCANNVACYTLTATEKYKMEYAQAQDVARSEQQNGFLPTKTISGRIDKPAALAQNALMVVDQVGTNLIVNAQPDAKTGESTPALLQIAEGAAMSIASRLINYGISDDAGKAAIAAKNDQFPFSLSYTAKTTNPKTGKEEGGLGISVPK